jgi:NAD+ diphosphatase
MSQLEFIPVTINKNFITSKDASKDSLVIIFSSNEVLLLNNNFPTLNDLENYYLENLLEIGSLDGKTCYGVFFKEFPENLFSIKNFPCQKQQIRTVFSTSLLSITTAISRAKELIYWRNQHKYCGSCANVLSPALNDLGMVCQKCNTVYYPQIAPAIIVAITKNNGKEILLAHNVRFTNNIFSLIAGFVEAGENIELAVQREIKEEIGITVKNIKYISSQPWPFPNSLMLAFHAEYDSGKAIADGVELTECNWYTKDNLPEIPSPGSVARKVVDSFIEGKFVK